MLTETDTKSFTEIKVKPYFLFNFSLKRRGVLADLGMRDLRLRNKQNMTDIHRQLDCHLKSQ